MASTEKVEDDFVTVERPAEAEGEVVASAPSVVTEAPTVASSEEAKNEKAPASAPLTAANLEEHDKASGACGGACGKGGVGVCGAGDDEEATEEEKKTMAGAGLLFGLSGLLVGGPLCGLLAGGGAVAAADPNVKNHVGDAARASGALAIRAGEKAGEKAKEAGEKAREADRELGILERIRGAFAGVGSRVKEFDEEHRVSAKVGDTMSDVGARVGDTMSEVGAKVGETMSEVGSRTVEFEKKHRFVESILGGLQNGIDYLVDRLRAATAGDADACCACADGERAAAGGDGVVVENDDGVVVMDSGAAPEDTVAKEKTIAVEDVSGGEDAVLVD